MRLLCFFLLSFHALLTGKITQTTDLQEIERICLAASQNSLVLFDVDGTLIVAEDSLLHPAARYFFKELVSSCKERDLFIEIRKQVSHQIVDSKSPELIQKIQQNGIPVFAFTAAPATVDERSPGEWRVQELKEFGFDFSLPEFPENMQLSQKSDQMYCPWFKQGVLYSSLHPKEDVLMDFLGHLHLKPETVIFIDDELRFIEAVISRLEQEDIPCIGIHYMGANQLPQALDFDEQKALFQVNYFLEKGIWLSDKAVKVIF